MHGDDDQIVTIADSALLAVKLVKNETPKMYQGAPHGTCTTHKNEVTADLLAFCKREAMRGRGSREFVRRSHSDSARHAPERVEGSAATSAARKAGQLVLPSVLVA